MSSFLKDYDIPDEDIPQVRKHVFQRLKSALSKVGRARQYAELVDDPTLVGGSDYDFRESRELLDELEREVMQEQRRLDKEKL